MAQVIPADFIHELHGNLMRFLMSGRNQTLTIKRKNSVSFRKLFIKENVWILNYWQQ